jgi:hypothetical protein
MAQVNLQSPAANPAVKRTLRRRLVARFIVSSISTAAGLVGFVLTGPIMCRIAALDPLSKVHISRLSSAGFGL